MPGSDEKLKQFIERLRVEVTSHASCSGYGSVRFQTDVWETDGVQFTNLALVHDTPGGLPGRINVCFDHGSGLFSLIDDVERVTDDIEEVIAWIVQQVRTISGTGRGEGKPHDRRHTVN